VSKTKAEREWMDAVANLYCAACGAYGVHVHHIRDERIKRHTLSIPLCPECHTGDFSIHKSKRQFESVYGSELHLLADTIERVMKGDGI